MADRHPEISCKPDKLFIQQGTFNDSKVEGLFWVTATLSGETDENGTFLFYEGQTITFYVGDIEIGLHLNHGIRPYSGLQKGPSLFALAGCLLAR